MGRVLHSKTVAIDIIEHVHEMFNYVNSYDHR